MVDKSGEILVVPSGRINLHGSILNECQLRVWESHGSRLHVGDLTVLGEHCSNDVNDDLQFRLIRRSHINEDVFGVQSNFAVFRVNDRRHRQNAVLCIVDDWVDW